MISFTTETGSTYEIDGSRVRRVSVDGNGMRRDGEWLQLLEVPLLPEVGHPMRFAIEPLAEDAAVTYRTTSYVTSVARFDADV